VKPIKSDPSIIPPKDLILDVHDLGEHIEQGDVQEAARIASQLAKKGVRLQPKPSRTGRNEQDFRIQVQLDGNDYGTDDHGPKLFLNVFPSTTIRELRAAFELSHQYQPSNQYFFVNGRLAHDDFTMNELNVGQNSLFVLFVLTYPKTFKKTETWKCPECNASNQPNIVRCRSCSATRRD